MALKMNYAYTSNSDKSKTQMCNQCSGQSRICTVQVIS